MSGANPKFLDADDQKPTRLRSRAKRLLQALPGGTRFIAGLPRFRLRFAPNRPRHVASSIPAPTGASPRLAVVISEPNLEFSGKLRALSRCFDVAGSGSLGGSDYIYAPETEAGCLSANQLINALLCVAHRPFDFLIVSGCLEEGATLTTAAPRDSLVLSCNAYREFEKAGRLPVGARGHLLRVVEKAVEHFPSPSIAPRALKDLGWGAIEWDQGELWIANDGGKVPPMPAPRRPHSPVIEFPEDARPLVYVIAIFMAVGGVERNLIEIMRKLEDRFRFVVVTTERVSMERGSLNHQALKHCQALLELGELAPQVFHLELLSISKAGCPPELLFICNGSPWLSSNSKELRAEFSDAAIVDQQAYDVREGWIEHYGDAEIQSFDRFVAINYGIREIFLGRLGMSEERVDLIYHAVDDERFNLEAAETHRRNVSGDVHGLRAEGRLFVQAGRLTIQKRPLDFLDLARRARDAGSGDRFLLVGDGELAGECDDYMAEHGLDHVSRISFSDDMATIFAFTDGLIVTSQYEGLPVVVLEALSMGVPVFATDVGDIRRVIEQYEVGSIAKSIGKPMELFQDFERWCARLDAFAERARAEAPRVAARFSAGEVAKQYDASWQKAIINHRDG